MPMLINWLLFQIVWAASLFGVVAGYPWLGLTTLLGFMLWHGINAPTAKADFAVALIAVCIGLLFDTLYVRNGLIAYNGELLWSNAAPLWILALWANFALTLNGCLHWLRKRRVLAAALAGVFGPLSYYGGIAFGTATVRSDPTLLYASIGVAWAAAVPLLLWLALRLEHYFEPDSTPQAAVTNA